MVIKKTIMQGEDDMNVSKELLEKAKAAKSAEELLALAKNEGIELTAEQAAKAFAELNKIGELSDEELDNVAGGGGGRPPKFSRNDRVSHKGSDGKAVYGTVVLIIPVESDYWYLVVDDGDIMGRPYYESELTPVGGGGTDPEICKSIM